MDDSFDCWNRFLVYHFHLELPNLELRNLELWNLELPIVGPLKVCSVVRQPRLALPDLFDFKSQN